MPAVNHEVEAAIDLLQNINIDQCRRQIIHENDLTRYILINEYFQELL